MDSITLTFGDCMENHVGMQKVGTLSENGYSLVDLIKFKKEFETKGIKCELINLNSYANEFAFDIIDAKEDNKNGKKDTACLLIVKNGLDYIDSKFADKLYAEQCKLEPDKKFYNNRTKQVNNKLARWNLCFDKNEQKSDYENKKGTIISYENVPKTKKLKSMVKKITGSKNLKLEANYYYDIGKTGISDHGDFERRKVVGVRLGKDNDLVFRWYKKSERVGREFRIKLKHGDMYIMSEKTVGTDWKCSSKFTLRHAAGCLKYTI